MTRKLLLSTLILIGITLAGTSNAMSVNFALGQDSVVDVDQNAFHGASIGTALSPGLGSSSFSLAPGQSREFDFFTVSLSGCRIICGGKATIDATLDMATPDVSAGGSALGKAISLGGWITAGTLVWNKQPGTFHTDMADFSVLFSDLHGMAFGSTYAVTATVTHLSPIPIPATGWLFGSILLGLVGAARLRGARAKMTVRT